MHARLRVFFGWSSTYIAEVPYEHVDGGDVKLMMKVWPAMTPRRHQAQLLAGDDAMKMLKRGATRPAHRGRHRAVAADVAVRTPWQDVAAMARRC